MPTFLASAVLAIVVAALSSPAFAALLIKVDKSAQTVTVIRDGQTLSTWPASTGKTGYATPSGTFTAFRMEADHFSKEWDDAPMPHSVFFTKQGHAIHGSFDVKRLGSPASHGCVRLAPADAAALFMLVQQEGLPNTRVVLTGSEQVALQSLQAQRSARRQATGTRLGRNQEAGGDATTQEPSRFPRSPFVEAYRQGGNLQRSNALARDMHAPRDTDGYGQERYSRPIYGQQRPTGRVTPSEPYDVTRTPYRGAGDPGLIYADPYDGSLRYIPR